MEYNQVSFKKVMLNIPTSQSEGINFNKGEMIKGQVQEVKPDGLVVLMIKGKLVEAASEVPVKPGQQLYLMVDDFRDGKTYLKVITPQLMGEIENTNISASLLNIGVPAKEDMVQLARILLQHNLPVTVNNLNDMVRGAKILGGDEARNLGMVAFALSRGLTVDKATMTALSRFASPGSDLNKALQSLLQTMAEISRQPDLPSNVTNQFQAAARGGITPMAANLSISGPGEASPIPAAAGQDSAVRVILTSLNGGDVKGSPPAGATIAAGGNDAAQPAAPQTPTAPGTGASPGIQSSGPGAPEVPAAPGTGASSGTQSLTSQISTLNDNSEANKSQANQPATSNNTNNPAAEQIMAADKAPATQSRPEIIGDKTGSPQLIKTGGGNEMPAWQATRPANIDEIPNTLPNRPPGNGENTVVPGERSTLGLGNAGPTAPGTPGEMLAARENVLRQFVALMRPLLDFMQINPDDSPARAASKIQNAVRSETDIIRGLLLLEDVLKNSVNREILKHPLLNELLLKLDSFEKELTGQRLFNMVARMPGENLVNSYYFSFPVRIDNEYRLCQLKIHKDSGKKQLVNIDNLKFIVSLDTPSLGLVLFHVNWKRSGELQLQGVVQNQRTCDYLNHNLNKLLDNLEGLGYQVLNLGIKVARHQKEMVLKPELEIVPDNMVRPFSIDLTI